MASTRRKTLAWDAAASVRFHWVKEVGEQPIDWQKCEVGTLDRSHWAIRSVGHPCSKEMVDFLRFVHIKPTNHWLVPIERLRRIHLSECPLPFLSNWPILNRPSLASFRRSLTYLFLYLSSKGQWKSTRATGSRVTLPLSKDRTAAILKSGTI